VDYSSEHLVLSSSPPGEVFIYSTVGAADRLRLINRAIAVVKTKPIANKNVEPIRILKIIPVPVVVLFGRENNPGKYSYTLRNTIVSRNGKSLYKIALYDVA
jgi:hypothetical protein